MSTSTSQRAVRTAEQRSRWARFLDAVAPAPSQDRLVTVAEISRDSVYFTQESLADVGVPYVMQQLGSTPGSAQRYRVLVAARDRGLASQVVGIV